MILFQSPFDVSVFPFSCFALVFSPLFASLEGLKEVGRERVLDGFLAALDEGRDFSLRPLRFG